MKETAEIIEMAKKMTDENQTDVAEALSHLFVSLAECLYDADYRKQEDGEWEIVKGSNGKEKMVCTNCRHQQDLASTFTYCPNCGAKMKGGAE